MSSTASLSTVSLTKPEDWPAWFNILESSAKLAKLWEYVDPTAQPALKLREPEVVTYSSELARLNRQLLQSFEAEVNSGTLGDTTLASFQPLKQLDEAQLRYLTIRQNECIIQYAQYAVQAGAHAELVTWIYQSVDPSLMGLCPATGDIRDIIIKLQALVG